MLVKKIDQGLACIAAGSNEADSRGGGVGGILDAQGRVRVCGGSVRQLAGGRKTASLREVDASTDGDLGLGRDESRGDSGANAASAEAHSRSRSREHYSDNS